MKTRVSTHTVRDLTGLHNFTCTSPHLDVDNVLHGNMVLKPYQLVIAGYF